MFRSSRGFSGSVAYVHKHIRSHTVQFIPYSPFPKAKTTRNRSRQQRTLFSLLAENGSPVLLTSDGSEPLRKEKQNRMQSAPLFDASGCKVKLKSSEELDCSRGQTKLSDHQRNRESHGSQLQKG